MERGWDPGVKKFLKKIITSLSLGLLWLMTGVTFGIYYKLAYKGGIGTVLFITGMVAALFFLIRYLYYTWRDDIKN